MGHRLSDLVEAEIGKLGPAFLEDALCDMIKPVADAIRQASRSGRFLAVVPSGAKLRNLAALHTGGVIPKVDPARYFCSALKGLAASATDKPTVCVYDPLAKAGDKDVLEPTDGISTVADEDVLYHIDTVAYPCETIVATARRKCISFHAFIMAVEGTGRAPPASTAAFAGDIANRLTLSVIDAFDQEGVVVWRRRGTAGI